LSDKLCVDGTVNDVAVVAPEDARLPTEAPPTTARLAPLKAPALATVAPLTAPENVPVVALTGLPTVVS
jgi:hypothetical protein